MEHGENSAFILARQIAAAAPGASARESDSHGSAASADPRLRGQLDIIVGRRLSQFSIAVGGTTLAFWGASIREVSREIYIEHRTIVLAYPGKPGAACAWNSEMVATALLSVLDQRVSNVTLTGGQLTVGFETGLTLQLEPDQHYESWQINSDNGLLRVANTRAAW